MQQRRIADSIQAARKRVKALRAAAPTSRRPAIVDETLLPQLDEILDELSQAEAEVREQGDRLAAARSALEARFRRYQDLFEFMPDGYLVTDEAGVIRDANKAAISLLGGGERKQVVGRAMASFVVLGDRALLRRQLTTAKRDARRAQEEIELTLKPSGRPSVPVALTVAAVRGDDALPDGFRLLVRDISAHRKIEQAAQAASAAQAANQAKDDFLAMLSHELRNPLHAIIGWSEILLTETLPAHEMLPALETIDRNGRQLNRLVGDLLDVSRIAQRKLVFEPQACDLTAILAEAFETVRSELRRRQQRFGAKLHDPGAVRADPTRVQQIVSNLFANAVKFTPEGGSIELRLDIHDGEIEIVVSDTGIGIEPDLLPYVFERFRQGHTAPTERGGGLGLGLPIARTLARMHGGDVSAESPGAGCGSTFTVRLPLRRVPEEPVNLDPGSSESLESHAQRLLGLHALIVCSDRGTAETVAHTLSLAGATASVASRPTEAPVRTAGWKADALVVVVPPSPQGGRLLAEVAALEKEVNGALPVLAITPSSAAARRWLSLPAEVALCTRADLEPPHLPSRLAVLAQISGWTPSL